MADEVLRARALLAAWRTGHAGQPLPIGLHVIDALATRTDAQTGQTRELLEARLAALLDAGANPTEFGIDQETVVHMAAMVNDPKYLKVLIDKNAPIDVVSPRGGRTPIFRAVESKRIEQFNLLVQAGADLKRVDSMNNSLLHVAAQTSGGDLVLKLLELGVDPRLRNAQQATFQPYFFTTPDKLLNADGKRARAAVKAWLADHGIPVEEAG